MATSRGKAAQRRKATPAARTDAKPSGRQPRRDGYSNDVTGLGTTRDKAQYGDFVAGIRRSTTWLDNLYHHNDIAATICDCIPEDALGHGWTLQFEHDDEGKLRTDIAEQMDALGAEAKLAKAWTWGRKSGLGAVHVGVEDGGAPEEPLNIERVTAVHFLTVYEKDELVPVEWYEDELHDAKFGEPAVYELRPLAIRTGPARVGGGWNRVHESRLILFGGANTSRREKLRNKDTDHSVLQRAVDALLEFSGSWAAVTHMVHDSSQMTMGIHNLAQKVANTPDVLEARAELVDFYRSVCRAVPYDKEKESLEYITRNFSGLSDVIRWIFQRMCAAAKIPMTRLFGMSPAGMNATGESDRAQYYDQVGSQRRRVAKPAVLQLATLLRQVHGGAPGRISVSFPSLWSMSPKEDAELRKTQMDTDTGYITAQVLLPEEVALARFTADGWSPETRIDLDAREKMLDAEIERAVDDAENPPEPPPVTPPGQPGAPAPGQPPAEEPPKPGAPEDDDEDPADAG